MEIFWLQWVHLIAAMVWLGGQLFLPLVLSPVLRRRMATEERIALISEVGERFRPIGWIALALLVITGLRRASLVFGGFPELAEAFSTTTYGRILQAKLLLVAVIVALQFLHDFVLGPRLRRIASERSPGLSRARSATIGLALGTLLLSLVVVGFAAKLRLQ